MDGHQQHESGEGIFQHLFHQVITAISDGYFRTIWILIAIIIQGAWNPIQLVDAGWANTNQQAIYDNQSQILDAIGNERQQSAERDLLLAELEEALASPGAGGATETDPSAAAQAAPPTRSPAQIQTDLRRISIESSNRSILLHSESRAQTPLSYSTSLKVILLIVLILSLLAISKYYEKLRDAGELSTFDKKYLFGVIIPVIVAIAGGTQIFIRPQLQRNLSPPEAWAIPSNAGATPGETSSEGSMTDAKRFEQWRQSSPNYSEPLKTESTFQFPVSAPSNTTSTELSDGANNSEATAGEGQSAEPTSWLVDVDGGSHRLAFATPTLAGVFDYKTKDYLCHVSTRNEIWGMDLSPDGSLVALSTTGGGVGVHRVVSGDAECPQVWISQVSNGTAADVMFDGNDSLYALSGDEYGSTLAQMNISDGGRILRQIGLEIGDAKTLSRVDDYIFVTTLDIASSKIDPQPPQGERWNAIVSTAGRDLESRYFQSMGAYDTDSLHGQFGVVSVEPSQCEINLFSLSTSSIENDRVKCDVGGIEVGSLTGPRLIITSSTVVTQLTLGESGEWDAEPLQTKAIGSVDVDIESGIVALAGNGYFEVLSFSP